MSEAQASLTFVSDQISSYKRLTETDPGITSGLPVTEEPSDGGPPMSALAI